ncbi:MAG: hypothetical protein M9897_00180 [Brumimicrobium sp.]|nr:hypothetical protein [Brumimicrobium sp.]
MDKEEIFKELITEMASDGDISPSEYKILVAKGKDLGLSQKAIDLLIQLELSTQKPAFENKVEIRSTFVDDKQSNEVYTFKSAITRGGSILTPDTIIIDGTTVTYKRRNKYLINTDSVSVAISKISSIKIDTSLWGTDIIIDTFGSGKIIGKNFTKSDAYEIQRLIKERQ